MNPPPIGDALTAGWNALKADPAPILVALLCAMLVTLIPLIGGLLAAPGMMYVGLKAVRGQKPEPTDGFIGLERLVDSLVMGLIQMAGILACCVGVFVTRAVFQPGLLLIVDKKVSWQEAKDRCIEEIWPNWLNWLLFDVVIGLVAASGVLLCVVGVFVTLPVAVCAMAYAYDQTLGRARLAS